MRADGEAALFEPVDERRQLRVAEPRIVGAICRGKADAVTRPGFNREADVARKLREVVHLQSRGVDFDLDDAHHDGDGRQNRDEHTPLDPPPDWTGMGGRKGTGGSWLCPLTSGQNRGIHLSDSLSRPAKGSVQNLPLPYD